MPEETMLAYGALLPYQNLTTATGENMTERAERHGDGRRIGDGHCDMHLENSSTLMQHSVDLSAIRSQNKLLIWLVPILLAGIGGMLNYYVGQTNESIKTMSISMSNVQAVVANASVSAAVNNQKLDTLERNVQLMMERR